MQKAFADIDIRDATSYKMKERQASMDEIAKMDGEHGMDWQPVGDHPPTIHRPTHHARRRHYGEPSAV